MTKGTGLAKRDEGSGGLMPLELTKEQKELIKRTVAKGSTDDELALFLHYCQKSGADPLRKQAHFIKRRDGSTTMMIGIDGFQAKATQDARYKGIISQAVREKDNFEMNPIDGTVKHTFGAVSRGKIVGAYAILIREGMPNATAWVSMEEYFQDTFIWKSKPEVMITKTARATLLRREYPDTFSGIYEPSEFGMDMAEDGEIVEAQPQPEQKPVIQKATKQPKVVEQPYLEPVHDHDDRQDAEPEVQEPVDADFKDVQEDKEKEGGSGETEETDAGEYIYPNLITPEEIASGLTPRDALGKILNKAFYDDHLPQVRKLVQEIVPDYTPGRMSPIHIHEDKVQEIVMALTGIKLKRVEKSTMCKTDGCKTKITKPEREEQDGLCLECWEKKNGE